VPTQSIVLFVILLRSAV